MAASGGFRLLGDLEKEVMAILWRDGTTTVRSVWQELTASRKLAYTTVMTVFSRLVGKGIVLVDQPRGARAHARRFWPAMTKEQLMQRAILHMCEELDATEAERHRVVEALHG